MFCASRKIALCLHDEEVGRETDVKPALLGLETQLRRSPSRP